MINIDYSMQNAPTVTDEDLKLLIGDKYEYYKKRWEAYERFSRKEPGTKFFGSFSWASFLNAYWLVYRKMYLYLLYYILGFWAIEGIIASLGITANYTWLSIGTSAAICICFGIFGPSIYKFYAFAKIQHIKTKYPVAEHQQRIIQAGGTSIAALILVIIAQIFLLLATTYGTAQEQMKPSFTYHIDLNGYECEFEYSQKDLTRQQAIQVLIQKLNEDRASVRVYR